MRPFFPVTAETHAFPTWLVSDVPKILSTLLLNASKNPCSTRMTIVETNAPTSHFFAFMRASGAPCARTKANPVHTQRTLVLDR